MSIPFAVCTCDILLVEFLGNESPFAELKLNLITCFDRLSRNELDSILCEFGSFMRTISYLGRHKSLDCSQPPLSRNRADPTVLWFG